MKQTSVLARSLVLVGCLGLAQTAPAALTFNGTNHHVTFGAATNLNNLGVTNFTIECWFKREGAGRRGTAGTGGVTNGIPLVTKGMGENEAGRTNMNFFFGLSTNALGQTILAADFEDFNTGLNHPVFGAGVVGSNVWVHGAVSYDMSGSNWVLYLNGVPDKTNIITGPAGITNDLMLLPRYDSVQHAAIASCLLSSGNTNSSSGFFAGAMEEVRIWNYARSAQEIADNYFKQIPTASGLIARWALNQTTGTVASNSVAGGVDGTLRNGPVWTNAYLVPLSVSLTNPANGSNVIGGWLDLVAAATPAPGTTITNVEFFDAAVKIGEDNAAPYTFNWCDVSPGSYSLTAVAYDDTGATATSSVVSVTVSLPAAAGALAFDGTNDYVSLGSAPQLGLSMFTIECWFKRTGVGRATTTGTGGITDALPLVTKGRGEAEGSNVDMNWFLGISTNNNVLAADFEEGIGGTSLGLNHPVRGNTPVANGVWTHAAATYDGGVWTLYLNGNVETNLTVSQPPRSDSIQHAALASALTSAGTPAGYFQGLLDEVRIWNYARSATQIADNYTLQVTNEAGLVARWALNEGAGLSAHNALCGGVNGTLLNGPVWSTDSFDANLAPTVSITNPANDSLISSTTVTMEATASDTDGSVTNVQFFSGGLFLGEDATEPYSFAWTGVAPGAYALTAVATDNLGLATTSAVVNVAVTPPPGVGGLYFDGVNDRVTFGDAAGLGVTNFTLECWFKLQGPGKLANTGTGGIRALPLITRGQGENEAGATNMNYFLGIGTNDSGQHVLAADFEDFNNGLNHPVRGEALVTSNQWQHAAVTYDMAGSNWVLYLNGVPDVTNTVTGPSGITNLLMLLPRFDSLQHAALGGTLRTGGTTNADTGFFAGTMDEARVWNYARSAEEIACAYQSQIPSAAGLIARWSLDDGTGLTATNSGSSAIDGTLAFGPVWVDGYAFPVAAMITDSPASTNAQCGDNVTFTVTATGDGLLVYQWYFNDTVLPGETSDQLSLTNVTAANAGSYAVTVANLASCGVTSAPAVLTVVDTTLPVITVCATNMTLSADTNCQAAIPDLIPQIVASDSCSAVTITQSPPAGTLVGIGDTVVTLTVTDAATNQATCQATITVLDGSVAEITAQPQSATNLVTTTATFTVTATSCGTIAYQWMLGTNTLSGENAATLTITNVQFSHGGDYTVVLSNSAGNVTSDVATLTVLLPVAPTLTAGPTLLINGDFHAEFTGSANVPYTVEFAGDVVSGSWQPLTNVTADANGLIVFEDTPVPAPGMRFYRVVYP